MNKILKIIGVNVLGIAVLAGGYIAYIIIEQKSKNAREEKVEITVKYDVEACAAQFPLHVIIQNGSDRTIYSIHFDIKVHRKGYSNNLNEWSWIKNESDKIIEPENFHSSCWHYKLKAGNERFNNPDNLIFEIGHKYIRFQRK